MMYISDDDDLKLEGDSTFDVVRNLDDFATNISNSLNNVASPIHHDAAISLDFIDESQGC